MQFTIRVDETIPEMKALSHRLRKAGKYLWVGSCYGGLHIRCFGEELMEENGALNELFSK